jgi:hypothetical protein
VVLRQKKCVPGSTEPRSDNDLGESVVAMEIRDATTETVLYHRTFPYSPGDESGSEAWGVSAGILTGTNRAGLLVNYWFNSEPSAPGRSPNWWQLFGLVNGRLKPFSGPLPFDEGLVQDETHGQAFRTTEPLGPLADTLEFKVSTGHHLNFIYPVRIDWDQGKLAPAKPCDKTSASGETCQYKVLAEDPWSLGRTTFVSLCPSPNEKCEKLEKVVVKPDSKVEFLVAQLGTEQWSEGATSGPSGKSGVNETMDDAGGPSWTPNNGQWLELRIDGKEGWIHSEEDFDALGLSLEL